MERFCSSLNCSCLFAFSIGSIPLSFNIASAFDYRNVFLAYVASCCATFYHCVNAPLRHLTNSDRLSDMVMTFSCIFVLILAWKPHWTPVPCAQLHTNFPNSTRLRSIITFGDQSALPIHIFCTWIAPR
jgi:hypothetical protein